MKVDDSEMYMKIQQGKELDKLVFNHTQKKLAQNIRRQSVKNSPAPSYTSPSCYSCVICVYAIMC